MGDLARKMQVYRRHWQLANMRGSAQCLSLNLQDMLALDYAINLTPGRDVVVQAGGNLGLFPKRLAEEFATVYTFEPDAELFKHLQHNAPEENIVPVKAALGDAEDAVSIRRARRTKKHAPVHEGLGFVDGPGDIPQVRIDALALRACNLLYLDIEGYELHALRGGEETLMKFRPTLAVESNACIGQYGSSREELHAWIVDHGYHKVTRLRGDDIYVPKERA